MIEGVWWADIRCIFACFGYAHLFSPSHCNHHHRTPDTKSATDNCCCSSGWLHNQHGGGNDCVCVCVFVCVCVCVKTDSFNGGLWHAVVPGWVMISQAASPHLFIVSQSLSLGHMSLKNKHNTQAPPSTIPFFLSNFQNHICLIVGH